MIVECPNCNKKFSLDKKLIPENGRTLKCSSCNHIWYYKIPITKNVDDVGITEDKNTNLDTNISEAEKKKDEHNAEINDDNLTAVNQRFLTKENTEDEEDKEDVIKEEIENEEDKEDVIKEEIENEEDKEDVIKEEIKNEEKQGKIKMIIVYIIVFIISILGLIFLLDTFKSYLFSMFPGITPFFDSFYETLLDLKLFIKDLAN